MRLLLFVLRESPPSVAPSWTESTKYYQWEGAFPHPLQDGMLASPFPAGSLGLSWHYWCASHWERG